MKLAQESIKMSNGKYFLKVLATEIVKHGYEWKTLFDKGKGTNIKRFVSREINHLMVWFLLAKNRV